ncbi:MAG: HD domain-containing protein [Candidatus Gastranaerophilales bacterium]|nr:HD domain-containing protein [Candidatus Gastranaerophilales bacterium]
MIDYSSEYVVKEFHLSDTKNGNKMGKLQLEDVKSKEVLNCVLWQEFIDNMDPKTLRTGNTVRIVTGEYKEQFKNVNIRELELLEEAPIGLEKEDREKLFNNILEVVNRFKDQSLKEAISKIIFENIELFKISPAAKSMHHNYVGGLMQHVFECIEFAQAIFPKFRQEIDHDTILAACIMHDIGKIFEYKIDLESGVIEYNEEFKKDWISHTQYSFSWAMNNGFKQLARIIAAHHGRTDWEAIIDLNQRDLEPELYLMHHIDDLSAKFGMVGVTDLNAVKV